MDYQWPISFAQFLIFPPYGSSDLTPTSRYSADVIRTGFLTGLLMGAYREGSLRGASFLAENSNKLPQTKGGFVNFQRARTNAIVRAGVEKGVLHGFKFASIISLLLIGETSLDIYNGCEQWFHPIVGGIFASTGISLYCKKIIY